MSQSLFSLENETAVVIGGTGVLGGGMADALAASGAKVVVMGRSKERGLARVKAIETAGGKAMFQAADAMDRASLAAASERAAALAWVRSHSALPMRPTAVANDSLNSVSPSA